jgi:acyl carrier protein
VQGTKCRVQGAGYKVQGTRCRGTRCKKSEAADIYTGERMNKNEIEAIVLACLKNTLVEMDFPPCEINEATRLVGKNAVLSSLGLVSLIVGIEQTLGEDFGLAVVIADERAMSQEKSPFLTVGSLSEYVTLLIREQAQ